MKIAIVTGASGNLGQAVVKKFIDEDYLVIGTAVPGDATQLDFPTDKFEKIIVDLGDEDASAKFIDEVLSKYKNIDFIFSFYLFNYKLNLFM